MYTLKELIHTGIQVVGAACGAQICASQVVNIEQKVWVWSADPISNPMYWYWSFGFVASLLISFFGVWDIYNFGVELTKGVQYENIEACNCDGKF